LRWIIDPGAHRGVLKSNNCAQHQRVRNRPTARVVEGHVESGARSASRACNKLPIIAPASAPQLNDFGKTEKPASMRSGPRYFPLSIEGSPD
jgi:hypothetical protein